MSVSPRTGQLWKNVSPESYDRTSTSLHRGSKYNKIGAGKGLTRVNVLL